MSGTAVWHPSSKHSLPAVANANKAPGPWGYILGSYRCQCKHSKGLSPATAPHLSALLEIYAPSPPFSPPSPSGFSSGAAITLTSECTVLLI